jgi:hypothetical protein
MVTSSTYYITREMNQYGEYCFFIYSDAKRKRLVDTMALRFDEWRGVNIENKNAVPGPCLPE